MARLAIFSKYFGYNVGGAERSTLELMKTEEAGGHQIVACLNTNPKSFGAAERHFSFPATWEVREFRLPADLIRFRFVEYFANKGMLRKFANSLADVDRLYAYGNLAPAVINAFQGETVYLVRDEYGLGWNVNYYQGKRRLVQSLYHASEAPLRALWRRDLHRAISRSHLIANSHFIADELRKLSPQDQIEVIYPQIDKAALVADYEQAIKQNSAERGVVVIGDNILKGGDIVRGVAERLPDIPFYVFDRQYTAPVIRQNIHFMPWQSPGGVYAYARLVMVPSRWAEAFARVIIEAQMLNIPVIGSARGGIPEAIGDPSLLVEEIEDPSEWARRIVRILGNSAYQQMDGRQLLAQQP